MTEHQANNKKLAELISKHIECDGVTNTHFDELKLFQHHATTELKVAICEPALVISAQGSKDFYLAGTRFTLHPDTCFIFCLPMALEDAVNEATEEQPLLGLGILLDRHRLARLILKLDTTSKAQRVSSSQQQEETTIANPSGLVQAPLENVIFEACVRLVACLNNPDDATMLGDSIIDEIYYRLLTGARGKELTRMLKLTGQLPQIFKAVNYLHENLDKNVSIDELAGMIHMSASGFHRKFKEVMQLPPLQYLKLVRLNKARSYIVEGKSIAFAAHAVGYNSPAHFSREYKRQFGTAPSDKPIKSALE